MIVEIYILTIFFIHLVFICIFILNNVSLRWIQMKHYVTDHGALLTSTYFGDRKISDFFTFHSLRNILPKSIKTNYSHFHKIFLYFFLKIVVARTQIIKDRHIYSSMKGHILFMCYKEFTICNTQNSKLLYQQRLYLFYTQI